MNSKITNFYHILPHFTTLLISNVFINISLQYNSLLSKKKGEIEKIIYFIKKDYICLDTEINDD